MILQLTAMLSIASFAVASNQKNELSCYHTTTAGITGELKQCEQPIPACVFVIGFSFNGTHSTEYHRYAGCTDFDPNGTTEMGRLYVHRIPNNRTMVTFLCCSNECNDEIPSAGPPTPCSYSLTTGQEGQMNTSEETTKETFSEPPVATPDVSCSPSSTAGQGGELKKCGETSNEQHTEPPVASPDLSCYHSSTAGQVGELKKCEETEPACVLVLWQSSNGTEQRRDARCYDQQNEDGFTLGQLDVSYMVDVNVSTYACNASGCNAKIPDELLSRNTTDDGSAGVVRVDELWKLLICIVLFLQYF